MQPIPTFYFNCVSFYFAFGNMSKLIPVIQEHQREEAHCPDGINLNYLLSSFSVLGTIQMVGHSSE